MNDLNKEATDIQSYLDVTTSNEPTELTERLATLMTYMSRSGEMLAQAKKLLRVKKTSEINKTIIAIAKQEHLSASVQNALLDSICEDESYLVDWIDRINRTCTHQIDGIRSLLSYVKEEMRFGK